MTNPIVPGDELMSLQEVATLLGYQSPKALMNRVYRRKPVPPYIKVEGARHISFFKSDVIAFLRSHRITDPLSSD